MSNLNLGEKYFQIYKDVKFTTRLGKCPKMCKETLSFHLYWVFCKKVLLLLIPTCNLKIYRRLWERNYSILWILLAIFKQQTTVIWSLLLEKSNEIFSSVIIFIIFRTLTSFAKDNSAIKALMYSDLFSDSYNQKEWMLFSFK